MRWILILAALVHLGFMGCELYPWRVPIALVDVLKGIPPIPVSSDPQVAAEQQKGIEAREKLAATVVHNAGIYNGIVAGGLFGAAYTGIAGTDLALGMLIGAVGGGIFGAAPRKPLVPAIQAVVGIAGVVMVMRAKHQN